MQRPNSSEYPSYFAGYINAVPEGDLPDLLEEQKRAAIELFRSLTEEDSGFRYLPEKWSIKETLGHVIDTERVMSYRLLRIGRGDTTPLPGFDQDELMKGASFDRRSLESLIKEYGAVRDSSLELFSGLPEESWTRQGTVADNGITARALAYIIAGHERHHVRILKERYLTELHTAE
ncbi:DinB family protein [Paenibacillus alkalitolerans]|uniref:DinB family protein n=1 Tax=Paenibacillus alkalitolerans TaxID=2799335 RepID=UPI0018F5BDAB|nr:DinB family protein [Paenibacillus alkalitolerans]